MKDLYSKVIPEIAKFEQKIMNFETTFEQNNLIMRQFDEVIAHKCDKLLLEQMKNEFSEKFASRDEQLRYIGKIET